MMNKNLFYVKTDNSITRIDWDKVEKTERLARLGQKGLLDIVLLKNGKYLKGHIVEQIIGGQMKFVLVDGTEQTIPSEDVFTIASEPSDMERSLWNQIEFLDRIYLKNGKIIEGFCLGVAFELHTVVVEDEHCIWVGLMSPYEGRVEEILADDCPY